MSKIQSVLFSLKYGWDLESSYNWLEDHELFPIKHADFSKKYISWRILDPSECKCIRTGKLNDAGIKFRFCFFEGDRCY